MYANLWETDSYPVLVLDKVLLSLSLYLYEGAKPHPSSVLDKNSAPLGPEFLSSTGAGGVGRKAPGAFPDSSSVLDKFWSANLVHSSSGQPPLYECA